MGSATSITSNARPTGSMTAAPGNSDQALHTSSRVAPAGTRGANPRGCAPGSGQSRRPHEQTPSGGPCAGHRVPAPEPRELGDGGALGRATAPARAGADLANAADREAHAPSNGSDAPMVTQRSNDVTLRTSASRRPLDSSGVRKCSGWCARLRAPLSAPLRPLPAVLCQVNRAQATGSSFEGVANGGVSGILVAGPVIAGLL